MPGVLLHDSPPHSLETFPRPVARLVVSKPNSPPLSVSRTALAKQAMCIHV